MYIYFEEGQLNRTAIFGSTLDNIYFHFSRSMDDSYRPVKLRKVVLGFPMHSNMSEFKFDLSLNYKLSGVIQTYSDRKPTLVVRTYLLFYP